MRNFLILLLALTTLSGCTKSRGPDLESQGQDTAGFRFAPILTNTERKALFQLAMNYHNGQDPKNLGGPEFPWNENTQIQSLESTNVNDETVSWIVTTKSLDSEARHEFTGKYSPTAEGKAATAIASTGLQSDFVCATISCSQIAVLLYQEENEIFGSIFFTRTSSPVKVATHITDAEILKNFPETLTKNLTANNENQLTATLNSIESYPGASSTTLEVSGLFTAQGNLVFGDGRCRDFDVKFDTDFDGKVCLAGNDGKGELILRLSKMVNDSEQVFWLTAGTSSKPYLPRAVLPTSETEIHPIIQSVLSDFEHPEIQKTIEDFWLKSGSSNIQRFLNLYQESHSDLPKGEALEFRKMLDSLEAEEYPLLTSAKVLVESNFQSKVKSKKGAGGYWQFMPGTAKVYGLSLAPVDERTLIEPSTKAAVAMLKRLGEGLPWGQDFKMMIAAYNLGEGGLLKRVGMLKSGLERENPTLSLEELASYSTNFWTLYEKQMLPPETRQHVPRVVSAMVILNQPEKFGFQGIAFPLK